MQLRNHKAYPSEPDLKQQVLILYLLSIIIIQFVIVGYATKVWFEDSTSCARWSTITLYAEVIVSTIVLFVMYYDGWHHRFKTHNMEIAMSLATLVYAWSATVVFGDCKAYKCLNLSSTIVTIWTILITVAIIINGIIVYFRMLMYGSKRIARFSTDVDVRHKYPMLSESIEESNEENEIDV